MYEWSLLFQPTFSLGRREKSWSPPKEPIILWNIVKKRKITVDFARTSFFCTLRNTNNIDHQIYKIWTKFQTREINQPANSRTESRFARGFSDAQIRDFCFNKTCGWFLYLSSNHKKKSLSNSDPKQIVSIYWLRSINYLKVKCNLNYSNGIRLAIVAIHLRKPPCHRSGETNMFW